MRILLAPLVLVFGIVLGVALVFAFLVIWAGLRLLILLIAGIVLAVDALIRRTRA